MLKVVTIWVSLWGFSFTSQSFANCRPVLERHWDELDQMSALYLSARIDLVTFQGIVAVTPVSDASRSFRDLFATQTSFPLDRLKQAFVLDTEVISPTVTFTLAVSPVAEAIKAPSHHFKNGAVMVTLDNRIHQDATLAQRLVARVQAWDRMRHSIESSNSENLKRLLATYLRPHPIEGLFLESSDSGDYSHETLSILIDPLAVDLDAFNQLVSQLVVGFKSRLN